jgi:hypothetical protein
MTDDRTAAVDVGANDVDHKKMLGADEGALPELLVAVLGTWRIGAVGPSHPLTTQR